MKLEDVLLKLNVIFKEVFQDSDIEIAYKTSANDIAQWDSFSNIELILNIENVFDIKFDLKELRNIENVGKLAEYILNKKVKI